MTRTKGYRLGRVCECGSVVSDRSASGLCRACYMRRLHNDPARGPKVSATLKRRLADPDNYARHCEQSRRAARTKKNNPAWRAMAAKVMREKIQPISVATGANRKRDFSAMLELAKEARWAWCPPEYRETYKAIRRKGYKPPEARQLIADQIKADKAKLSPFERQERALQRGAQLVANDAKPSLARPGVYGDAA